MVKAYKEGLVDQIALILSEGVQQGAFEVTDLKASARALFDATSRFHHPAHADEWSDPQIDARIDALLALLLRGLEAPCTNGTRRPSSSRCPRSCRPRRTVPA